ncbi:MAG TPA: peptide chain release factor 2 [Erysipelothrix sp.]|nr:peptide chain release factor 2 [Erysipelothrix sp.]
MLFDITSKKDQLQALQDAQLAPDFWADPKAAQAHISETNRLSSLIERFDKLHRNFTDFDTSLNELKDDFDAEMYELITIELEENIEEFNDFEILVLLSGEYDAHSAILEIHPGAGGTESQDWASMLYRMYTRWASDKGYKVTVINYLDGDEAGLKSVTIQIDGDYAYGYLKSEMGVHRLVRISPFDSSGRRHTSFSSVDVMPVLDDSLDVEINPKDLEIDTHRASGAGGQHVNKTDSAVRITHIPTGLSVHVQSERSQMQNRAQAMNILKTKLELLRIHEHAAKISDLKGEQKNIEWGSQIRSYVFMPYTLVKDVRTGVEVGNVQSVMDGNIDPFIQGYLKSLLKID